MVEKIYFVADTHSMCFPQVQLRMCLFDRLGIRSTRCLACGVSDDYGLHSRALSPKARMEFPVARCLVLARVQSTTLSDFAIYNSLKRAHLLCCNIYFFTYSFLHPKPPPIVLNIALLHAYIDNLQRVLDNMRPSARAGGSRPEKRPG